MPAAIDMSPPWHDRAVKMARQGFGGTEIAEALGKTRSAVYQILRKRGVAIDRRYGPKAVPLQQHYGKREARILDPEV
jgi:transposase-like protein